MSDGSSPTQIGRCGVNEPMVDSIDSLTSITTEEDETSEAESSYVSDPEEEGPVSIVTNLRPSPSLEAPQAEEKHPAGGRIAKDTGCCLYSAITALFVMVVLLGIVLIVTGPVLGLPFPPLMRANTPMILPPLDHNHLTANLSEDSNLNDTNHDDQQFQSMHYDADLIDPISNHSTDSFEYDYLEEHMPANLTEYLAQHNETGIFNETVIEDLANLSPEALRTKYVAYVPVPLKFDDDYEQTDDTDDFHDSETNDRHDEHVDHDAIYFDEPSAQTPRTSSVRRRPSATIEKVLLPIVMVPESGTVDDRAKTSHGADAWRSNDFSGHRQSYPPRRFDEDQSSGQQADGVDDEDHLTSSSRRIPGLNPPRRSGGDRRRGPGLDYRMFGSLTQPENRNRRPFRPRQRERFRPRDDFGRTTSLHPHRVLPPQGRLRSRINKNSNRGQLLEGREGNPSLYIRPPPRPRPRIHHPPRPRVHRPSPQDAWLSRQRTVDPPPVTSTTKRPAYSYPRDAMSIQDIISYMTSMSHSEQTTKKPAEPVGPEHRTAVWTNTDYYANNPEGRSRVGQSYPPVLPAPPGISRSHDSMPVESHRNAGASNPHNPYSFKLDVYPIRDGLGGDSYVPSGPAYRQHSVPPPSNYHRHRPSYQESRQPSGDSSGSLSGINFSYKIRYDASDTNKWSYSSYSSSSPDPYSSYRPQRRPTGSGYHDGYTKYREDDEEDAMPVPLAFRPRRPESTTPKPKLIVHLNVFNQGNKGTGSRNRYAEQRHSEDEEEDYYSPSDIYRAVLRNNAPKGDHEAGGDDGIMQSGQSRVDTFAHHRMDSAAGLTADSAASSSGAGDTYDSHNMAASPSDQYYRSLVTRRPSSGGSGHAGNNYRLSHQSRNFYPAADDDVPEPLPMPMAAQLSNSTDAGCAGADCAGHPDGRTLNNTQLTPLV
ncbi:hypothetical protein GHT06_021330 [Daphnia sinensis]|uniref:Uncharacterized protein n=1 Tax=Daphnia sinensis TaxID=1820382 RepID=A0AAD5PQR1_9CRUS|nr:hypothetical protein GHT06_021330 [Daphnia sinensis]